MTASTRIGLWTLSAVLSAVVMAQESPTFTTKPTAERTNGKTRIRFAVSKPTDVAVYIEDKEGHVIRHLVAGVLSDPSTASGKVSSPAPLKPGLEQELEWDGKADYGKDAGAGPFKVRVAIGLQAKYDKVVHSTLADFRETGALAAGPDGTLYVSLGGIRGYGGSQWRKFSREGVFQGMLGVPPGPEAAKYFEWPSETGEPDPARYRQTKHMNSGWVFTGGPSGSDAVVVGPRGKFLYVLGASNPPRINQYPLTASVPKNGKCSVKLEGISAKGIMGSGLTPQGCLAISSDAKRIFIGGLAADKSRNPNTRKPLAAVYSVSCPERTGARLFYGDPSKTGKGSTLLGGLATGLAVDGKGLLLIADLKNNRIIAVDEKDGTYRAEIPSKAPSRLGFCARTRALYVLSAGKRGQTFSRFKLPSKATPEAFKALKPEAGLSLRQNSDAYLAVDAAATPTIVWIGGGWKPTYRIEDSGSGAKFGKVTRIAPPPNSSKWGQDNIPFSDLHVDRLRKEIYCRVGGNGRSRLRFNEKTGKSEIIELHPLFMLGGGAGLHAVPAPNGDLYGKQWSKYLYRFDRSGKPKAFEKPRRVTPDDLKAGIRPAKLKDAYIKRKHVANVGVAMSVLPHTLGARWSDGHIFSIEPYRWNGKSLGGRTHKALHEYLPSGERVTKPDGPIIWKLSDATLGPKFDAAGNIYVAEGVRPEGWTMPQELVDAFKKKGIEVKLTGKRGGHYSGYKGAIGIAADMYGSIVKFTPRGGMVHWNKERKKSPNACGLNPYVGEPKLAPSLKTTTIEYGGQYMRCGVKVTGAEWIHPGISHVGHFGCNCENVTFDVDEFGRVFYPDPVLFRVCVIDTGGNLITRFGGYGGVNHMGTDSPVVDPGTQKLRPRNPSDPRTLKSPFASPDIAFSWLVGVGVTDKYAYMGDSKNQRLLRAKLVYAADERCEIK